MSAGGSGVMSLARGKMDMMSDRKLIVACTTQVECEKANSECDERCDRALIALQLGND